MYRIIVAVALTLAVIAPWAAWAQEETDTVGIYLAHDVDHHLYLARAYLLEKKNQASADEIRNAVSFLNLEAEHTGIRTEGALDASIRELRKLADDIEKGKVTSEKELNMAFARAHRAMAQQYFAASSTNWQQKKVQETRDSLKAAAAHLRLALIWANYEGEEVVVAAEKAITVVADKLTQAGGWAEEEVTKVIQELGKAIEQLHYDK
jgi:hypothetical protein